MATLYKFEVQTLKDGTKAVAPTATYTGDSAEKDAEIAFHNSVAYNLAVDTLKDFLVEIITETGVVVPNMTRYYNFENEEV